MRRFQSTVEGAFAYTPFKRLAQAQAGHAAGDGMVAVAMANTLFFAVPIGEARDRVALYLALTMAPFAVLSPLLGPWLDRHRGSYRIAIIAGGAGRAVLAIVLSSRTDHLVLYPLAFGLLVLSRLHGVSRSSLVPDVVPPDRQPVWCNSWLAVISVLAGSVGALFAAAANALAGPGLALWIAAIVFAWLVFPALRLPHENVEAEPRPHVADYRALLTGRLLAGGIAMAANRVIVGYTVFLLAFLLRADGQPVSGFVFVVAAAGVGGFVGSVVAPPLRAVMRESLMLLAALGASLVVALWASAAFGLLRAAVLAGAVGIVAGAARLAFDSLVQHDAPESIRGRAFARYETIFQLGWVGGSALAVVVPFGPPGGLRTLALIAFVGIVLSVRGLARTKR